MRGSRCARALGRATSRCRRGGDGTTAAIAANEVRGAAGQCSALLPRARPTNSTLRAAESFLIVIPKQPNEVLVVGPDFLGDVIVWNRSCAHCCGIEVALLSGRFDSHDRRSSLVR